MVAAVVAPLLPSCDLKDEQCHGTPSKRALYASLVKDCGDLKDPLQAKAVHRQIQGSEHCGDRFLANLLIEMYGKCGCLEDARFVFERIPQPNAHSWNIMLSAYALNGHVGAARRMFDRIPQKDATSWTAILSAYTRNGLLYDAQIMFETMPHENVTSSNSMITAYAENGDLHKARSIFDKMRERDLVSWNAMIEAYVCNGYLQQALNIFDQMPERDVVSWTAILTAHAEHGQLEEARDIFDTMPCRNVVSWNAITQAYVKRGQMEGARSMFNRMPQQNVVSWTTMITGYAQNGHMDEAESLFEKMPQRNTVTWTAMVSGYAQNGYMAEARAMFDKMPQRNLVSWNAMISGYVQNEHSKEGLRLFTIMDQEGMQPDSSTFICALYACASLAALAIGKEVHACCIELHQPDAELGSALINMYSKCGRIHEARLVFDGLPEQNVVSWSAMVAAYAQVGHVKKALDLFWRMEQEGVMPNEITGLSILFACNHAGLLAECWQYFVRMATDYGVSLIVEHYHCIIDLLGRAGRLEEAEELINNMPILPGAITWKILLAACRMHGDLERGDRAAEHVLKLDLKSSAPYTLLSNMCSG